MLTRLPRTLPPAAALLEDLAHPTADDLARALGVGARTVQRWRSADEWPRPAHLSLFFASRWGWSAVECDALHSVNLHTALSASLRREVERLSAEVERLAALPAYGAANGPLVSLRSPVPSLRPTGAGSTLSLVAVDQ